MKLSRMENLISFGHSLCNCGSFHLSASGLPSECSEYIRLSGTHCSGFFQLDGNFHVGKMTRFQCVFIVHCVAVSSSLFVKSQKTSSFLTDAAHGGRHLCLVVLSAVA